MSSAYEHVLHMSSRRRLMRGAIPFLLAITAFAQPRVAIETEAGVIEIVLDSNAAPVTAANFLKYVDAGRYDGGAFHRTVKTKPDNQPQNTVKIDVIQAGVDRERAGPDFPEIPLERTLKTGLKHVDGAVSMARSTPDSATSDFFICIGGQPSLDYGGRRNPDGQGFAVFGRVVRGMDVVRKIQQSHAQGQSLVPPVRILGAKRLPEVQRPSSPGAPR
jgi:peptidyl-prolyl cis-trans isomerase A (cyclophilin A)